MKTFGHTRPVRDRDGKITGSKPSIVRCRTVGELSGQFGTDKGKRLVVSLERGDIIGLRPERTKRPLMIGAADLYWMLLRQESQRQLNTAYAIRQKKIAERLAARASKD